jgi:hypothetical protein
MHIDFCHLLNCLTLSKLCLIKDNKVEEIKFELRVKKILYLAPTMFELELK